MASSGLLPADDDAAEIIWKSIALTHVEYPVGDTVGRILAVFSLVPLIIIVGFATLVIFKRDLHTLTYFSGLLLNEAFNYTLKNVIKEERPGPKNRSVHVKYGMPSSHSQLMWFFSTYFILFLFIRVQNHTNSRLKEFAWKSGIALVSMFAAITVTYSRVYLLYHTSPQVIWGATLGMIIGLLWFAFTQYVLTPVFPIIESWPVSQFLMLRDTTLIPNVMWFDYTAQRNESKSRQRKLLSVNRKKSQ